MSNFCIHSCFNFLCFNWKMRRTYGWVMLFFFLFCLKSLISLFLSPSFIDALLKEVVERQFLCSGVHWPGSTFWGNTRRSHVENIIDFIHQCQTKMNSTIQVSAQNAGGRETLRDHDKSFLLLGCFLLLLFLLLVLFFVWFGLGFFL